MQECSKPGERLRRHLRRRGERHKDFARRVGCDESYLSHVVAGRYTPGLRLAVRIERATEGLVRATDWVPVDEADASATDAPSTDLAGGADSAAEHEAA